MPTTGRRVLCDATKLRCSPLVWRGFSADRRTERVSGGNAFCKPLTDFRTNALGGFGDDAIDDSAQIPRLFVHCQLAVRARAAPHDLEGVLDFSAASQLVYDVIDEPLQHLCKQLRGRKLLALAEIY